MRDPPAPRRRQVAHAAVHRRGEVRDAVHSPARKAPREGSAPEGWPDAPGTPPAHPAPHVPGRRRDARADPRGRARGLALLAGQERSLAGPAPRGRRRAQRTAHRRAAAVGGSPRLRPGSRAGRADRCHGGRSDRARAESPADPRAAPASGHRPTRCGGPQLHPARDRARAPGAAPAPDPDGKVPGRRRVVGAQRRDGTGRPRGRGPAAPGRAPTTSSGWRCPCRTCGDAG